MSLTIPALPGARLVEIPIPLTVDEAELSPLERPLFERLSSAQRRREWWSGRVAARLALEAIGAHGLSVTADPRGVPVLEGAGSERFSLAITHGRREAAAIASPLEAPHPFVGLDLLDEEDLPRLRKLGSRAVRDEERALSRDQRFPLVVWGAKEAVAKATSTGMFAFALGAVRILAYSGTTGEIRTNLGGSRVMHIERSRPGCLVVAGVDAWARKEARLRAQLSGP